MRELLAAAAGFPRRTLTLDGGGATTTLAAAGLQSGDSLLVAPATDG